MNRTQLLEKATAAVNARPVGYDLPEQNFDRIARRWKVHLLNRYGIDVTVDAADVAIMCADLKLARLEFSIGHEDSWVDLAGYAACGAEVATGKVIDAVANDGWEPGPWPNDLRGGDFVRVGNNQANWVPDGEYEVDAREGVFDGTPLASIDPRRQLAFKRVTSALTHGA